MYAGFFGLAQKPFSIAPDPHYLYLSERHREALAHLLYGVQAGGGFVLLTGEIGAGKTTVCRAFLEQVPEHCRVAYIFNPKLTVNELLRTICQEFGVPVLHEGPGPATLTDYLEPLNAHLLASHAQGQQNLLIIDEAQSLTPHVLEQLRLLTNLETAERKLLQIVLIGQPELRQLLAQPELEQLAQRVIARFHLGALSEDETRQYIAHRMGVAGHTGPLPFDDAAVARIHALTRGVPRRINLLCDRALLGAYASDRRHIDRSIVDRAAQEVFDTAATAPGQGATRRTPAGAGLSLGLGVLGGAAVLGLAALALSSGLWPWPAAQTGAPVAAPPPAAPAPGQIPPGTPAARPAQTAAATSASPGPVSPLPGDAAPVGQRPPEPPAMASLPPRSELLSSETAGWQELGPLWGQALDDKAPCVQAQALGLQCFRTRRMSLYGLRQIDRPGVLTLQMDDGPARVLLTRLHADSATLQAGERRWRVTLDALATAWRGDYATLWRTPPGSSGRISSTSRGPAGQWLARQLVALQAAGHLPSQADTDAERLRTLQQVRGIERGLTSTALTFMEVNRTSGVDEPRLTPP